MRRDIPHQSHRQHRHTPYQSKAMLLLSCLLLLIPICRTNADATWSIRFVTLTDPDNDHLHCCGISFTNFGNLNRDCTVSCFGPPWGYVREETDICEKVDWDQQRTGYSLITGPDYKPTWPASEVCPFYSNVTLWPPVEANGNQAYVAVFMDDNDQGCPLGSGLQTLKDSTNVPACNATYPLLTS